MSELTLFAKITPKAEHREVALDAIAGILERTRAEPGCRRFELHADEAEGGSLYLIEHWSDDAALVVHHAQDYTREVFDAYREWLAAPVEIVRMRPVA